MATRAAINILGSNGELIDIVSLGVGSVTTEHRDVGHYRVLGTLGMAPPPLGWGYVINQMDVGAEVNILYEHDVLNVFVTKEGSPADLLHSITLHVAVDDLPIPDIREPDQLDTDPAEKVIIQSQKLRAAADFTMAPLQDAFDIGEATEQEALSLNAWKKYRLLLSRISEQAGYPHSIDWPEIPI
ncbi:tail fiber assembly protein [Pseudomonas syringae]|uniref:tail fiber assembly protein n=1 Tax=Pseudomonas syringae TaxID=317 RepID=UPI001BD135D3|nr:tail fiber assembly protein [Pseudomonas syringae]QVI69629.1 tail fiber assembly protein [Pseudomonas syringae]